MQVVGYDTVPEAAILLASDGDVEREALVPGRELAYSLGERRCAGTLDGAAHVACDRERAPYCDQHSHVWVCARCTGTCLKDEMDCRQTHAVYLAAFAPDTFKVGVTKLARLETRLREQGADRAAHVRTVSDGRIARGIEAEIAAEVPDRVRAPTKRSSLHRSVDEAAWERFLDDYEVIEPYDLDYGLDLRDAPVAETLATGTVVGTQGRILVLENGGTTYGVDLRDLVGYELDSETTERDLQSSLGAFG